MKPSTNNSGSQAAALLLTAAIASSSSSLAAAAADDSNTSSPAGVTCVDPSSLRLNECLTAGNAICSPGGGWAFGVDPADQRIKLWEGDEALFVSSKWDNAQAICIGGNADLYGPHDYAWYDDRLPYLFVSYDGGNSKAFLQCNSLLGAAAAISANGQAHLNIEDTPKTIGSSNAPVVAFQLNDDAKNSLWSVDAWGSVKTSPGCQWYTDEVGFTAELAVGEDFGQQELTGVKQDTAAENGNEEEQEGERTRKYMLRPVRSRWGGNAGDEKQARTKWGSNVLQPRTAQNNGATKAPKASKAPKATKAPKASKSPTVARTKAPKATKSPTVDVLNVNLSNIAMVASTLTQLKAPKATKSPTVARTKAPKATKSPTIASTKAPKATKSPTVASTKAPKATKSPTIASTKAPKATKSPSV